jgi:hypothetical protein
VKKIKIIVLLVALCCGLVVAQDRQSPPLEKLEITQSEWLDIESARDKVVEIGKKREAAKALYEMYSSDYDMAMSTYNVTLNRIFAPQGFNPDEYEINASDREVKSRTVQANGSQEKKRWDRLQRVR